jgi:hypothetical protein
MKAVFLILLMGSLNMLPAHAKDYYPLRLTSEKLGRDKVSKIGVRTNDRNEIESVLYFESGEAEPYVYSVQSAQKKSVVMVKYLIFKIAKFKLSDVTPNSMTLNFDYAHDHKGMSMIYRQKVIKFNWNPNLNRFYAFDGATGQPIKLIHATNHEVDGDIRGIDELQAE